MPTSDQPTPCGPLTPGAPVRYSAQYLADLGPTASDRDRHIRGRVATLVAGTGFPSVTVRWADGFTSELGAAHLALCEGEPANDDGDNAARAFLLAQARRADAAAGSPQCVVCGCTNNAACPGGCCWVSETPPVCSQCADGVADVVAILVPTDAERAAARVLARRP